jgi:hypothetical protein
VTAQKKIPDFATLDDAVEFWETHSFADYADDTEPVDIVVNLPSKGDRMRIELDTTLTRAVRTAARRRHVAPTRLVRRWIEEHLHRERQAA